MQVPARKRSLSFSLPHGLGREHAPCEQAHRDFVADAQCGSRWRFDFDESACARNGDFRASCGA
jgi:hypothetical protein